MKKAITAAIAASVLMIGCTNQSTEVKRLQAENDSLLQVNAQTTADFNEMIQLMNDVEEGFRQIKEAENYLVTQKDANGEVSLKDMNAGTQLRCTPEDAALAVRDGLKALASEKLIKVN